MAAFLDGVNCTFMCYTGSGKTHSLGMGAPPAAAAPTAPATSAAAAAAAAAAIAIDDSTGIVPRAIAMLFDSLDQPPASPTSAAPSEIADACSPAASASVSVSFLELYNEEWGDLLASPAARASMSPGPAPPSAASNASGRHARQSMQPLPLQTSSSAHGSPVSPSAASPAASPRIQIRQHPNGRVFVSGVTEIPVASQLEALRCLHRGVAMRSTAKTAMNSESSRSHAIFSITLTRRTDRATTTSQFHFVDLAGSERLKRTKSTGDRMAEGISINQGLLTLGRVVAALVNNANASPDQSPAVVPYRESKLTRMLQNSLGGNSKTFILACISALDADANETINTLKYATALRQIRNSFHVNVDAVAGSDAVLEECRARLRELQDENTALRKQLDDANALVGGSTQTRLGELESVVHALEARLAQIQEERAVVESVSAARIKDLEEQLESWQRQFEDLESKMEQDSVYTRSTEDTLATALLRMAAPAMLAARDAAGSASPRSDAVSVAQSTCAPHTPPKPASASLSSSSPSLLLPLPPPQPPPQPPPPPPPLHHLSHQSPLPSVLGDDMASPWSHLARLLVHDQSAIPALPVHLQQQLLHHHLVMQHHHQQQMQHYLLQHQIQHQHYHQHYQQQLPQYQHAHSHQHQHQHQHQHEHQHLPRQSIDSLDLAHSHGSAYQLCASQNGRPASSASSGTSLQMLLAAQRASRIEADQSMQHGAAARVVQTVNATLPLALQHNVYATPAPTVSRSSIVPPGTNLSGTAAAADGIDASSLDGADAFQTHGSLFRRVSASPVPDSLASVHQADTPMDCDSAPQTLNVSDSCGGVRSQMPSAPAAATSTAAAAAVVASAAAALVMLSPLERQELEDEISLNEFLLRYLFFLY